MTPRARTLLVALLAAVVAVRVSASQPLTAGAARVGHDPLASLRHALVGWTDLGTLGGATVQGVRDLPLAGWFWLGDQMGLDAGLLQMSWRVAVGVLATVGAVRLARLGTGRMSGKRASEPWTPWVAATLFGAGVVLVPVLVRSPLDGLAAAALPWIVAPLVGPRPLRWTASAGSAAWIGLAGVGSPYWAAAALVAGLVAVLPRLRRRELVPVFVWVVMTAAAAVWWIALAVWELTYARDVTALLPDAEVRDLVVDAFGTGMPIPFPVLVAVTLGPLAVVAVVLAMRPPGADLFLVAGLTTIALGGLVAWGTGLWEPAAVAPAAGEPAAGVLGPCLGLVGLAALVAWTPLVGALGPRFHEVWESRSVPTSVGDGLAVAAGVLVVLLAVGGMATAAVEREVADDTAALQSGVAAWSRIADPGRVLVLPAGDASATDLGLALGDRPWVARTDLPPSGAGGTAALDDLISRLSRGDAGPGTVNGLQRLGISYVLVALGGPTAADRLHPVGLVRAALAEMGATRVRVLSSDAPTSEAPPFDVGLRGRTRQVEVWSLDAPSDARVYGGEPVEIVGDAGSVSDLANAGFPQDRAVHLTDDLSRAPLVVSDSARRRDLDQRVAADPYGPDLQKDQPRTVVPPDAAPTTTTVLRLEGVDAVTASSSASDVGAPSRRDGADALAAIDSNVFTAWQSAPGTGVGEWWEVDLGLARSLDGGTVQLTRSAFAGNELTRVRLTTDAGSAVVDVPADGLLTLDDAEPTSTLRLTALEVNGEPGPTASVGIAEVTIPAVEVREPLVVSGGSADGWLLAARTGSSAQCVPALPTVHDGGPAPLSTLCSRAVSVPGADAGSLARVLDNPASGTVEGHAWVRAAGTVQAAAVADDLGRPSVLATSSSVAAQDLATRAQAAADHNTTTAWRPAPDDAFPTLTLAWEGPAEVTGVRLVTPAGTFASTPTRVRVATQVTPDTRGAAPEVVTTEAEVDEDGLVPLPGDRADQLTITFLEDSDVRTVGSVTGSAQPVPVAVGEVELLGGPQVSYDADSVRSLPCGSGPDVLVGGEKVQTRVTTSAQEVVAGSTIAAQMCDEVELGEGETDVEVVATFTWQPLGLLLSRTDGQLAEDTLTAQPTPRSYRLLDWLSDLGSTTVGVGDPGTTRTLVVRVPAGDGWSASGERGALDRVVVDGWAQGWAVPADETEVELSYPPAESLRSSAAVGAAAWALVVLVGTAGAVAAVVRSRRSR